MNQNSKSLIKCTALSLFLLYGTVVAAQTKPASKPAATATKSEIKAPAKMKSLDLTSVGINATIEVPEDVNIIKDDYNILLGNGKNILIQIEETSEPFSAKVDFVKGNSIRGFSKFMQQDATSYIAIMNPFGSQVEYDFAYFTTINGVQYILQDPGSERHAEAKDVSAMLAMAKSIKGK